MQQPVSNDNTITVQLPAKGTSKPNSEEASSAQPMVHNYYDLFPALPQASQTSYTPTAKLRVGSSVITQVFHVPYEERRFDRSNKFGEDGALPTACAQIMNSTGAHIEISSSKDQSLTFLVTGKLKDVQEARKKILSQFQAEASKQISIPKEHHKFILGKNGAKLRDLESSTATKIQVPAISDNSDLITITGTKEGIERAEHEIRLLSDERTKNTTIHVDVPKIYHPFIHGPNGERVAKMIAETGVRIIVPPPSVMKDDIIILGDKEAATSVAQRIQEIHHEMAKKCTTVCVQVPKSQHKFVIGPRGSTIAEILSETGVSVELPPSDSDIDTITLRGPQEKLGLALNKVYDKAMSIKISHINAPEWIHRYIIGRKGESIKKITQDLTNVHVEFSDSIKIEGPPKDVEKVQADLESAIKELLEKYSIDEINVDPKIFKQLTAKSNQILNRLKRKNSVFVNADNPNVIKVEGEKENVNQFKIDLEETMEELKNEVEISVKIDQRYYKSLIGFKGDGVKEINTLYQVKLDFPSPNEKRDVIIRGPKNKVNMCQKYLLERVAELKESSYVLEVPIYKQLHKIVIGKGGANIKKIRDETKTRIDLPSEVENNNVITITGRKENVEEARDRILKIQNELADQTVEEVSIPPKYYNSLIGSGGKLIHSIIEDCGGVAIKFPLHDSNSDKVVITGPKTDVERAKQQLLELTSERELCSYSVEVRAKPEQYRFIIGKNGANVRKIREATDTRILFPNDKESDVITIIGRKEQVERAKEEIETVIREVGKIVEDEIQVDPKHHKRFIARRGELLHKITNECGGVMISFPRSNETSDRVVLKGVRDGIDAAKARILEIVRQIESEVTIECVIAQHHHRTVMGVKGSKVQRIVSDYDVQIKFPERDQPVEEESQVNGESDAPRLCDIIKITGQKENCLEAKEALLKCVPITINVEVPYDFHKPIIGYKGKDIKELMDRHDVHISMSPADQKLDSIKITGTPENVESAKKAIEKKCEELKAAKIERELKSFELQIIVNSEYHPKIIGRRGAIINEIRKEYDVIIAFPKREDPNQNLITITGYQEKAHAARDAIMKIVDELNQLHREEVRIDPRVHSRIIGVRGHNIRRIMDEYKVEVQFPREGAGPDLVIITGKEDDVLEVKDVLLNLEEEYLSDIYDSELRESYRSPKKKTAAGGDGNQGSKDEGVSEFCVQGGPWEQRTPNTSSIEEFPCMGGTRNSKQVSSAQPAVPVAWGPRQ